MSRDERIKELVRRVLAGAAARPLIARMLARRMREAQALDEAMPDGAMPTDEDHKIAADDDPHPRRKKR